MPAGLIDSSPRLGAMLSRWFHLLYGPRQNPREHGARQLSFSLIRLGFAQPPQENLTFFLP